MHILRRSNHTTGPLSGRIASYGASHVATALISYIQSILSHTSHLRPPDSGGWVTLQSYPFEYTLRLIIVWSNIGVSILAEDWWRLLAQKCSKIRKWWLKNWCWATSIRLIRSIGYFLPTPNEQNKGGVADFSLEPIPIFWESIFSYTIKSVCSPILEPKIHSTAPFEVLYALWYINLVTRYLSTYYKAIWRIKVPTRRYDA